MDDKQPEKTFMSSFGSNMIEPFKSKMEHAASENKVNSNATTDELKLDAGGKMNSFMKKPGKEYQKHLEEPGKDEEGIDSQRKSELPDALNHPALPTEVIIPQGLLIGDFLSV